MKWPALTVEFKQTDQHSATKVACVTNTDELVYTTLIYKDIKTDLSVGIELKWFRFTIGTLTVSSLDPSS